MPDQASAPPPGAPDHSKAAHEAYARRRAEIIRRPNGGALLLWGVVLIVGGAILALISVLQPDVSDPGQPGIGGYLAAVPPTINVWKCPMLGLGSTAISLGVVLWALGLVVRAIYFLPGREVTRGEMDDAGQPISNRPAQ